MIIYGNPYRSVWMEHDKVFMINQKLLPFRFEIETCKSYRDCCLMIRDMTIRGAGSLGACAGFAMAQAFQEAAKDHVSEMNTFLSAIIQAKQEIESTRPTARDLFFAVNRVYETAINALSGVNFGEAARVAVKEANCIADEYVKNACLIGEYGNDLIHEHDNILTHCNAGWLALVDHGSALSPLFKAAGTGKHFHVWIDETRPRSQGAKLTAWELSHAGIPHTIIADNTAGFLMSRGKISLVITGADRIAANGDTANKIGTLGKAVLAKEYNIPFYVAAPLSTFDDSCRTGEDIIIEERDGEEILSVTGPDKNDAWHEISVANPGSRAYNPAFDITPVRYITGFITEQGIKLRNDTNNLMAPNHQGRSK